MNQQLLKEHVLDIISFYLSEDDEKKYKNPKTGRMVGKQRALQIGLIQNKKSEKKNINYKEKPSKEKNKTHNSSSNNTEVKPINHMFNDDHMLDNYFNAYNSDLNSLEKPELNAINKYKDFGGENINNSLRKSKLSNLKPQEKEQIKLIDKAFDKIKTKHDLTLYRGISTKDENFAKHLSSLKPGNTFIDPGYTSTSIKPDISDKFKNMDKNSHKFQIEILAPKGSKALPMQNLGDESTQEIYKDEYEMLLPRNQKFKIISNKDGKIVMQIV